MEIKVTEIIGYRLYEGRPDNGELVLVDIGHSHPIYAQYDIKTDSFYRISSNTEINFKQILGWSPIPILKYEK